jgi:predicted exporter
VVWLVVGLAAVTQVLFSLRVDSDLTAFMPRTGTEEQALLLSELKVGAGSRLWLLALTTESSTDLAELSRRFANELEVSGYFSSIYEGQTPMDTAIQELLFKYRYLLDPVGGKSQFTTSALRRAFETGLERLRLPTSPFDKKLIASDPTGALRRVVDAMQPSGFEVHRRDGAWMSQDGTQSFLVAETKADGMDLDAQEQVAIKIKAAFSATKHNHKAVLVVGGLPALATATKARIQREVLIFSIVSPVLLITILYIVFRSLLLVVLIFVPIAGGLLVAVAVTSAVFGVVHGINLAFGAILLGVTIDYPVHLISHVRDGESLVQAVPRVWPTLLLGLMTTVLGFTAMLTAEFPGIQQLAVFSISGLISAALLTRYLLVPLGVGLGQKLPRFHEFAASIDRVTVKIWWLAPIVLVVALTHVWREPAALFASDIAQLSTVPAKILAQDRDIRTAMGGVKSEHVLLVRGDSTESMLQRQELLLPVFRQAIGSGLLQDFDMAAQILPSAAAQRARLAALPDSKTLLVQIDDARQGLPFRDGAFQRFIEDIEEARKLEVVNSAAFGETALGRRLDNLIRRDIDGVVGTINLIGLSQPGEFQALIENAAPQNVFFISLKASTNELINNYRDDILVRSGYALILITGILGIVLRNWYRVLRVMVPVIGAALTAATIPILAGSALNIFHLVSLLLVVGIGLDYSLFFSRSSADSIESASIRHSVLICAVSTVAVFAILTLSQTPVLRSIGTIVSIGSLTAFVLSGFVNRLHSHEKP